MVGGKSYLVYKNCLDPMAHLEVYSITVLEIEWNFALAGGDGHIL